MLKIRNQDYQLDLIDTAGQVNTASWFKAKGAHYFIIRCYHSAVFQCTCSSTGQFVSQEFNITKSVTFIDHSWSEKRSDRFVCFACFNWRTSCPLPGWVFLRASVLFYEHRWLCSSLLGHITEKVFSPPEWNWCLSAYNYMVLKFHIRGPLWKAWNGQEVKYKTYIRNAIIIYYK